MPLGRVKKQSNRAIIPLKSKTKQSDKTKIALKKLLKAHRAQG